ncbi:LysR family transcriptional regulator [Shewanella corallii]|uniref:LysR family transcriptional regulator n=1 Tax=Shewanella corallii TaxID=560080 RepID=A0ABT0N333_9GAMM|nr:LysR family transcriptional regulator [Shewanella corallii]MCL2912505.1 LysR family transcriptional regulator [Shewanella corallii]
MNYLALSRVSMKHLAVFQLMLRTQSVTLAAERLCVTPSSISKTLSQLRELLDDELFYREGNQLTPTPYAISLAPSVQDILARVNGLIAEGEFNPQTWVGQFSLSMRASTLELFSGAISRLSQSLASSVSLNIFAKEQLGFDALLRGEVHFLLLPHDITQPPVLHRDLVWKTVIKDELVCLMNPDHPLASQPLTLERYLQYRHIGIHDRELAEPYFIQHLTQAFHARDVALTVADFGGAASLCSQTDYLLTCSKLWADNAPQANRLLQTTLPFDYGKVGYSLVWNRNSLKDPALSWLHQQLLKLLPIATS